MHSILITSFDRAEQILSDKSLGNLCNVVSIGGRETLPPNGFYRSAIKNRLRLTFDDVWTTGAIKAGYEPATPLDIQKIIEFSHRIHGGTLVHCAAGIRRSSAAAIILTIAKLGRGYEDAAIDYAVRLKHDIDPNKWMIRLADRLLQLDGRLFEALMRRFPAPRDNLLGG